MEVQVDATEKARINIHDVKTSNIPKEATLKNILPDFSTYILKIGEVEVRMFVDKNEKTAGDPVICGAS
jgi:hypothetical protein